jgi:hypothetical protein
VNEVTRLQAWARASRVDLRMHGAVKPP